MFKALLKKQFKELNAAYFRNRKTGKKRSGLGTAGMIVLYIFLFAMIAVSFFGVAFMMASSLVPAGFGWLYFVIMSLLAVFLGVFGGVFSTYAGLYLAKDNEMLLAMPIPPHKILAVRMIGVYAMGFLYEALVFIPAVAAYILTGAASAAGIILSVLMIFVLAFLVLTLSCFFGWLVALLSSRLKNKSFITVIISLVFFGVYYYFCMNYYSAIENLIAHAAEVGVKIKSSAYPLYLLGRAAEGHLPSFLLATLAILALAALTWLVLSKSFIKITTRQASGTKAVYHEKPVKQKSLASTLLLKEWKRFSTSPNYMLNCAMGTFLMPAAGIAALIFREDITEFISLISLPADMMAVMAVAGVFLIASMNDIAAPSVSLEGKNLWILQSLPANAADALEAKERLHTLITLPPVIILSLCLTIAIGADFTTGLLMVLTAAAFVVLHARLSLAINLLKPNLDWTNEVVPIKQSASVSISLFGGWILAILCGAGGYFALKIAEGYQYLLLLLLLFTFASRFVKRWLATKGAAIFSRL